MTTATLAYKAIHKKFTAVSMPLAVVLRARPRFSWRAGYTLAIGLLLLLAVAYVLQINALTAGAYTMKTSQKEFTKLLETNRGLEAHFAQTGFLGGFLEKAKDHQFEKTTVIKYLQMLEPAFAKAN